MNCTSLPFTPQPAGARDTLANPEIRDTNAFMEEKKKVDGLGDSSALEVANHGDKKIKTK